ncbi:MAG: hypothetical protein HQK84_10720 [Nitrospinae bacterium]|nr:hypothetical protein [Nitrospinota bacterium]
METYGVLLIGLGVIFLLGLIIMFLKSGGPDLGDNEWSIDIDNIETTNEKSGEDR